MRFAIELDLNTESFPKDKNRVIVSLFKHCLEKYDRKYFETLYSQTSQKDYTFSLYLGYGSVFERDHIRIPTKKIIINFSCYEPVDGLMFYNAFIAQLHKPYTFQDVTMTLSSLTLKKERIITSESISFKTLSPIVVRDHLGDNNSTWYYSLKEDKGIEIFKRNLTNQLTEKFGPSVHYDLEKMNIHTTSKDVKIKNYSIVILANITKIDINAKTYLLEYLYKAGCGSKKSLGFGMLDII